MKKNKKYNCDEKFLMPLNKYLSYAGVCSRRKAVEYIKNGLVKVNGEVVKIPQRRVAHDDQIMFKNKILFPDKKVYVLLNKPKDYVTTLSDQQGRKTVVDLVVDATKKRVYPVGRLDRATTGLLLLTNDGQLTQKLAHPKYEVQKIYDVVLNRPLKFLELQAIRSGLKLKDGIIKVDKIIFVPGRSKNNIRVHLHSGKNRIVRRIFENFGYGVVKLDRINYAGLTKHGLSVGSWRFLTEKEVKDLKKSGMILQKKEKTKK